MGISFVSIFRVAIPFYPIDFDKFTRKYKIHFIYFQKRVYIVQMSVVIKCLITGSLLLTRINFNARMGK